MSVLLDYQNDQKIQHCIAKMKSKCDPTEAKMALVELSLTSVMFGDFLVVMNSDFDLIIGEEPHLALMLLYNVRTGRFMARIWSQTVRVGEAESLEDFVEACKEHFGQGRPCLGCPQDKSEVLNQGFLLSHTPIPRKISRYCEIFLGRDCIEGKQACQECLKLEEGVEQNSASEVCKMEIKDQKEEEEWPGYKQDCDDQYDMILEHDSKSFDDKLSKDDHKCPWCEEVFTSYGPLTYHKKTKHFYGPFKCQLCNFKAPFAQDLVRHMEGRFGDGSGDIMCPKCKERFPLDAIVPHYEKCVMDGKRKCPWCSKEFNPINGGFDYHRYVINKL